jgi:hypothetical protein
MRARNGSTICAMERIGKKTDAIGGDGTSNQSVLGATDQAGGEYEPIDDHYRLSAI